MSDLDDMLRRRMHDPSLQPTAEQRAEIKARTRAESAALLAKNSGWSVGGISTVQAEHRGRGPGLMAENGVDLGAVITMLAELQTQMRQGFGTLDAKFGFLRGEFGQLGDDMHHGLEDPRQTLDFYHQAIIGQRVTLSEQDQRLRKPEARMELPPVAT